MWEWRDFISPHLTFFCWGTLISVTQAWSFLLPPSFLTRASRVNYQTKKFGKKVSKCTQHYSTSFSLGLAPLQREYILLCAGSFPKLIWGFVNHGTTDILDQIILCCMACSVFLESLASFLAWIYQMPIALSQLRPSKYFKMLPSVPQGWRLPLIWTTALRHAFTERVAWDWMYASV